MKLKSICICFFLLSTCTVWAQQSGNQVIGQNFNDNPAGKQAVARLFLSDSTFVIQANVLMNTLADGYVATFGVSESAITLKEANEKMDNRIQKFVSALSANLNLQRADIFVDMTTQTQIADYKVNENYAEQFISGFEQKKNVIVKFKNIKDLDKMVVIASDYGIYDLAKVDYIITDINKIYVKLFQSATEVINSKKELYAKATNIRLASSSEIYGESFYSFYPAQLYKSYTPNISTEYHSYQSYEKIKNLKSNTTYYYDHIDYSAFDQVINPMVTEPVVECVLMLQIKFYIVSGNQK